MTNKRKKSKKRPLLTLIFMSVVVAFTAQTCGKQTTPEPDPVNLAFWSVFRDKSDYEELFQKYKKVKPNVTITYRKLKFNEYENKLVDAFSLDRGPDIFSIHNDWLPKYQQRLEPMPNDLMTLRTFESNFAEVATDDFVSQDQIWAIPMSIDTLGLYYNKDHFDQENIPEPPKTWDELRLNVKQLTKTDAIGNFTQHGIAMGTAENINRSIDILYLLMLQNQTPIVNNNRTRMTFTNALTDSEGGSFFPGREALQFYIDFASPNKDVYTYNPDSDFSIDAFSQGRASMMFNYSFHTDTLRSLAPDLNFEVVGTPQIKGADQEGKKVNFANYFGETVSNKSKNAREAWEFLQWASQKEQLALFLKETKLPTSRRDMVNDQIEDPDLNVFAEQILTAESVYKPNAVTVDNIFAEMIKSVNVGNTTIDEALSTAENRINTLFTD